MTIDVERQVLEEVGKVGDAEEEEEVGKDDMLQRKRGVQQDELSKEQQPSPQEVQKVDSGGDWFLEDRTGSQFDTNTGRGSNITFGSIVSIDFDAEKGTACGEVRTETEDLESEQFSADKSAGNGKSHTEIEDLEGLQFDAEDSTSSGKSHTEIEELESDNFSKEIEGIQIDAGSSRIDGKSNSEIEELERAEVDAEKAGKAAETGSISLEEYDLERILDEQETHDLYCPKCNSCITKKVILRKRKRTAKIQRDEPPKRVQHEDAPLIVPAEPAAPSAAPREPEIFRCLSCFSFFIPTDGGFNIFDIFGRKSDIQNQQRLQQSNENCSSWLFSCFQGPRDQNNFPAQTEASPGKLAAQAEANIATKVETTTTGYESVPEVDEPVIHQEAAVVRTVSLKERAPSQDQTRTPMMAGEAISNDAAQPAEEQQPAIVPTAAPEPGTVVRTTITMPKVKVQEEIQPLYEYEDDGVGPSAAGVQPSPAKPSVFHDQGFSPVGSPIVGPRGDTIVDLEGVLSREEASWDILKPIVYGGLAESITSLSVVSSASAAELPTWNIVALGLASLVGGLVVILHNISDLRNTRDTDDEADEHASCYWAQLGRRSKHRLHLVVAAASYLLFGILPLFVYAYTFRKSNIREYKLMSAAGASLICIGVLAIGKAHVRPVKTYAQTLFYYLAIGASASGLSYVAGVMLMKLMVQFGLITDNSSAHAPPSLLTGSNSGILNLSSY